METANLGLIFLPEDKGAIKASLSTSCTRIWHPCEHGTEWGWFPGRLGIDPQYPRFRLPYCFAFRRQSSSLPHISLSPARSMRRLDL